MPHLFQRTCWLFASIVLSTCCLDGDPNPTEGQTSSGVGSTGTPDAGSSACSKTSTQPVNLPFRNAFTDRSVRLFWVDPTCKEVPYSVLAPGQSYVQQTFVTHLWRVRDNTTHVLYKEFVPTTTAPPGGRRSLMGPRRSRCFARQVGGSTTRTWSSRSCSGSTLFGASVIMS